VKSLLFVVKLLTITTMPVNVSSVRLAFVCTVASVLILVIAVVSFVASSSVAVILVIVWKRSALRMHSLTGWRRKEGLWPLLVLK